MIGLDTNALVRYFVRDDEEQVETVERWLEQAEAQGEMLHVDVIVLCEIVWVLGSVYRRDREDIASALGRLLEAEQLSIADRQVVHRAVEHYRRGPGGFSDYVIGERNLAAGCRVTKTFDRALLSSSLFEGPARGA